MSSVSAPGLERFPVALVRRHWRFVTTAMLGATVLAGLLATGHIAMAAVLLAASALSWRHLIGREVWPGIVTGDLTRATRRCWDEWQRRDWAAMAPRMAPDIEMIDMAEGQTYRGPGAVSERLKRFVEAFPDGMLAVLQVDESPERTTSQLAFWGHQDGPYDGHAPTGRLVHARFCEVFTYRHGRIVRVEEYYDRLSMLSQLGLLSEDTLEPAPAQAGSRPPMVSQ